MTTLLRKLSWKSQLKFGEFEDSTVRMVFDLGLKERTRLVWYYYNCSNITYMDEILSEMKIGEDVKIDKPSKNPSMFYKWKRTLSENERMGLSSAIGADIARKKRGATAASNKNYSTRSLLKKNHGH